MEDSREILILPYFGQGHLFPAAELCKHLSSHNCKPIFIIPSHLSSSIPSDLQVLQIPLSSPAPPPPNEPHHELGQRIQAFLSETYEDNIRARPAFVVMDVMMSWSKEIFKKANIPIVSFFTSGACSPALSYAAWHVENAGLDDTQLLSGLPESRSRYSDHISKRWDCPGPDYDGGLSNTRWMDDTEGSTVLLINTCDVLEAPFLEFLSDQVGKPVFGVGPLLPETFWKSICSVVHNRDSRPNRGANYTEDEVIQWLDSKPRGSVIYVSFGSEVGPTLKEYDELAEALVESKQSFIWVIQPGAGRPGPPPGIFGAKDTSDSEEEKGYEPHGLEDRVGNRGLIIKGWAPQLSILSHPSTGGFLSHCGWNSTLEGIGLGVPILAWPIRGDQFHDARLVVEHLKVGHVVPNAHDISRMVKKADILQGIEGVMGDEDVRGRAAALRAIFEAGYPSTSAASLKALIEVITTENA